MAKPKRMISFDVKGDKRLTKKFKKYAKRVKDPRLALARFGAYMVEQTNKRFKDEKNPSGKKWAKSKRAKREGGKTMQDTGQLITSLDMQVIRKKSVIIGFGANYAKYHNPDKQSRQILGISRKDENHFVDLIAKHVEWK